MNKSTVYARASAFLFATLMLFLGMSYSYGATVTPPKRLKDKGVITYCSDIASPPLEYYDKNHKPIGSDIEIGNHIAKLMGLKAKWVNVPFAGILPALLAGHCDAIISQLFDKPARRKKIDFVDYMNSSEAILVPYGNPQNIKNLQDLSGKSVAVENGTTVRTLLEAENKKLSQEGKKTMNIVVFPRDTDALEQLRIHQVDAYGTTLESAAYYIKVAPKTFAVAGKPFHRIITGIGIRKDEKPLKKAIAEALHTMRQDGTYMKIFEKWNLKGDAL